MWFWIAIVIGIILLVPVALLGIVVFGLRDDVKRMIEEESVPVSRGGNWGKIPGTPLPGEPAPSPMPSGAL